MVGVLSSRRLILGVLFSQKSTFGGSISPETYEHIRSARQEPSTRRKNRPRRRKSSRTRAAQLDPSASSMPALRDQLNKKRSADQVTPHSCHLPQVVGGPSPPVKHNRNIEPCQYR